MAEREIGSGTATWQSAALQNLDALYGFAMSLTHSPVEAEDLVQETYMHAMQHFGHLRPDSNVKAWLFTILRNSWLKKLRHARSGPNFVALDEDDVKHQAVDNDDPETLYFRIWERDEVRQALRELPHQCTEIIVLRDIEGFSYEELAEILECPMGTVMSRLARARAKLKHLLCSRWASTPNLNNGRSTD